MEKEKIVKKANEIMEETKNEQQKYHEERLTIFKLMTNIDDNFNLEILENLIKIYEKNKNKIELKEIIGHRDFRKQDIKKSKKILLFKIIDQKKNIYTFFTRENAKKYIQDNKNLFDENPKIQPIENTNMDLEKII